MSTSELHTRQIGWIAAGAVAAATFLFDVFVPLGITVPMLYAVPILLTWLVSGWGITAVLTGLSLVLTGLGIALSPGNFTMAVAADRAIALGLQLIVGWLVIQQKRAVRQRDEADRAVREMNATLEQRVHERTAQLAEANERWNWVVRATNDGIWDWDLVHGKVYCSPRWKAIHEYQDHDAVVSGEEWSARIYSEDRYRVLASLDQYLQGKQPRFCEEYRVQKKDGTYGWVLDRGIAIFNAEGRALRIVGANSDITWRKEAEEALCRREHEFRSLADNVPALFSYIDRDQRYRFVNKRYEEFFGRPAEEIVGLSMAELLGPHGYGEVRLYLERAFRGESISFEYRLAVGDGSTRWLSARYVPDRDEAGHVVGLFVLLTDISEIKATQALLQDREGQLRDLSTQLLRVQEDERRRISRDLHDDVMQRMGALTLELYALASSPSSLEKDVRLQIKTCGTSAEQLTTDLQRMAHQLHPSMLEYVGLEVAMRDHLNEFAGRTGVSTEFMTRRVPKVVPLEQATCLYRVLQEGLQNVQKHANATAVLVRLLRTTQGVGLCVRDNGRGITDVDRVARRKGLGLTSMAERVGMLNGTFRIRTTPHDGTEIRAWVPLENVTRES